MAKHWDSFLSYCTCIGKSGWQDCTASSRRLTQVYEIIHVRSTKNFQKVV